jgi:peptidoglycan/xylan/chitin deacetylase (PgdA/CDA1 family)
MSMDRSAVEVPGLSMCAVDVTGPSRPIVMTYDDGPEPGGTEPILRALQARGATATFFVLMSRVRRYRTLLAEVVAAGHEIGLHGPDHRMLTELAPVDVTRRTADARSELEDVLGEPVRWFRPPYGEQSEDSWRAVLRTGLTPVLWGATLEDWHDVAASERLAAAAAIAGRGTIVLAHDGYANLDDGVDDGPAPLFDRGELTREVLDLYAGMGLTACALERALASGTPASSVWLTTPKPQDTPEP